MRFGQIILGQAGAALAQEWGMELLVRQAGGEQILLLGKPHMNFAVASSGHRVEDLCPLSASSRQDPKVFY